MLAASNKIAYKMHGRLTTLHLGFAVDTPESDAKPIHLASCLVQLYTLNMTKEALLQEILKLPVADRMLLVETIWDSIAATPEQVPIPTWHREELDRRLAETAPEHLTWDEVQARLQQAS